MAYVDSEDYTLNARKRGFHLITDEIEQQIHDINSLSVGLLHLFYPTYLSLPVSR